MKTQIIIIEVEVAYEGFSETHNLKPSSWEWQRLFNKREIFKNSFAVWMKVNKVEEKLK